MKLSQAYKWHSQISLTNKGSETSAAHAAKMVDFTSNSLSALTANWNNEPVIMAAMEVLSRAYP